MCNLNWFYANVACVMHSLFTHALIPFWLVGKLTRIRLRLRAIISDYAQSFEITSVFSYEWPFCSPMRETKTVTITVTVSNCPLIWVDVRAPFREVIMRPKRHNGYHTDKKHTDTETCLIILMSRVFFYNKNMKSCQTTDIWNVDIFIFFKW